MVKQVMTVNEIAKQSDVTPDAIRHYVKIGLLSPTRNPDNQYNYFDNNDVQRVRFVRRAKTLGYTLSEIGEILHHSDDGHSPCPKVREIIQKRIVENREKLQELIALQERMENALEQWESMPDQLPDGDSICHLIEGFVVLDTAT